MGCAPTNRKRTTVPAAEAKPSRSSYVEKGEDRVEEKENITSIEDFHRLPSQHKDKEKEKRSFRSGRMKGSSKTKIEAFEDIVIKDERRGFTVEAMDF